MGDLDLATLGRERQLVQLEACLDLVLVRFRSWVHSIDDLEDCRANVLSRVWNETIVLQLIDEGRFAELNGWLHRCIRNELLDWHRSRKRAVALRARAVFASPPLISPYESIDFNLQLQHALDNLPQSQARLISLAYVEGLSPGEIALLQGRSPDAVRRALSRAREATRDQWHLEEM